MNRRAVGHLLAASLLGVVFACGSSDPDRSSARDAGSVQGETDASFVTTSADGGARVCSADGLDQEGCNCPAAGQTRACYTAAPETRGKGVCKDGTQTCQRQGEFLSWSPCEGANGPGKEACASKVDINCNGSVGCEDPSCATDAICDTPCTDGATRPCYEGKPGTGNVGACKDGQQSCIGGHWTKSCTGQVLPGAEAGHCADGVDNDCNGLVDCLDPACATQPACCVNNPAPADATIWANSPKTLYRIDPNTLAVTTVGSFGIADSITDLALTPSGVLYAVSFTKIYTVDKATAAATPVITLSGTGNDGMTFLPNGKLLAGDSAGDVKLIDPATGAFSTIGNYGNGLKTAGDLVAVKNGTMYATSAAAAGGADATSNNVLIQVNAQTGAATAVGPTGHANVWGVAYANGHVIGFTTAGKILRIDVATGAATVVATKNIEFWGATQSPLVDGNLCP